MRFRILASVCLAVLAARAVPVHAQGQFHIFTRLTDKSGAAVTSATPDMFGILEDGVEGPIVKVEPVNWPLKLQLLVDTGIGMGGPNLGQVRSSLRTLIEALPPDAEVTLVTTAPQPRFLVRPTKDRAALLGGVDRLTPDEVSGNFVTSLAEALSRIARDKSDHFPVILTVGTTTGDAYGSERDVREIQERLSERGTVVHVLLMVTGPTLSSGANQTDVGLLATKTTGGRFETINIPSALGPMLTSFADQITKTFGASNGRYRVTVQRPSGKSGPLGKIGFVTRGGLRSSDESVQAN